MSSPIILSPRAVWTTWIVWGVLLIAACGVMFSQKGRRPVNDAYARGAARWVARQNLYEKEGWGFIYLPQAAVLYVPFSLVPKPWQDFLWRSVTVGLFALGLYRMCRMAGRMAGLEYFPLVSLFVLPKAWTLAINGQATPAMAGLSMLALAELSSRRWWRAAALLILALAVKPLAIVLGLLIAALFRPMLSRLAVGMVILCAVPFLVQDSQYVIEQYLGAIDMLGAAAGRGMTREWAQIFSLGSLAGIDISQFWQTVVRIMAALGTLALCRQVLRRHGTSAVAGDFCKLRTDTSAPGRLAYALIDIYAFASAYLLLFNPRTENNSYLILSPVIAILCLQAQFVERRPIKAGLLGAAAVAIFSGHVLCTVLTPQAGFIWVGPLVCLLFSLGLIFEVVSSSVCRVSNLEPPGPNRIDSMPSVVPMSVAEG